MINTTKTLSLVAAAALLCCATPSIGRAQYAPQCIYDTQCAPGTACRNGACVPMGQPTYAAPQTYVGQPTYVAQPAPGRQSRTSRARPALWIPAIPLIAGGWAANVFVGLFSGMCVDLSWSSSGSDPCAGSTMGHWDAFRWVSFVPVAGPWIQFALIPTASSDNSAWYTFLAIDGALQAAGLTMLILSFVFAEEVNAYSVGEPNGVRLAIVPEVGPSTSGLSLLGRF